MSRAKRSRGGVRYRWVVLAVAFLVHATCIALIWQSVPPLKQAMAADIASPWQQVVVVYAAISFGMMATQLPGGALSDRYSVRGVVAAGAVLAGAATAVRFAVPTLAGQVAVSVAATVGMGLVNPNLIKVITDWFPTDQLGLGQGVLMSGNTLAAGLAMSLSGGAVLAAVGSWGAVFVLYGGLTVAAGVLWFAFVRSPTDGERPQNPATGLPFTTGEQIPLRSSLSAVLRAPSTPWAVALSGLAFWAILGSLAVLPEFADAQPYAVPEGYLGTPLFLATVGAIALPVLSDRYGRCVGLHVGLVGLGFGILLTGFAPSLSVFVLGMVVAGLFGGGLNAMFYLLPGELTDIDRAHVGTMAGVVLSLSQFGAVVSTVTSAQVLAAHGVELSAAFVALPALAGVGLVGKLRLGGAAEATEQRTAPVSDVDD